jgi:A/G-specific adenine glycosylase
MTATVLFSSHGPLEVDTSAFQHAVFSWYDRHRRDLPWRRTSDPYAIAISEVMLQQTQVDRVGPKYHEFLARFPNWKALAEATVGQVLRVWAPLGYNNRAVRLQLLARWVVANGGDLPADEALLRTMPGLGPYTAAAIAAFAFGQRTTVIDTNIRRVIGRALLGQPYPKPSFDRQLRSIAALLVPKERHSDWHQALMDVGAMVCSTRQPLCSACPLADLCSARSMLLDEGQPQPRATTESFNGSRRYYRGRFLDALRAVPDGEALPLTALGPKLRSDYDQAHTEWLQDLTHRLVADGLVRYDSEAKTVSLP